MPLYPLNHTITLAENASATQPGQIWPGGMGMFNAEGTFGGGTVTLQVRSPSGTWMAVGADTTLTAAGAAGFVAPTGAMLRAAIATATAVYAYVSALP